MSNYLELTRNSTNRKDLMKLHLSNHKLMIEIGRYDLTPHNDRFCPVCNSGVIENKVHFFLHCPSIQPQGKNSMIKSNKILLILISYLAQN